MQHDKFFTLAILLWSLLSLSEGVIFSVPAHNTECFYEQLEVGHDVRITYFVTQGGNNDIDFEVLSPGGTVIYSATREREGKFFFIAEKQGKHSFCFSNRMSTLTAKTVSLSLIATAPTKEKESDNVEMEQLKYEILQLSEGIHSIQSEEKYLRLREQTHRDTTESTNSRVLTWTLIETSSLIAVSIFQIIYLKRFFEVKRSV